MNSRDHIPEQLAQQIDDYLSGSLDESGIVDLERQLKASDAARAYFVRYCKLDTDLHLIARARSAGTRALNRIVEQESRKNVRSGNQPHVRAFANSVRFWAVVAAALVVSLLGINWLARQSRPPSPFVEIAWLVNAQNCDWESAVEGSFVAGQTLRIRQGLAELRMAGGAKLILEGPAELQLVSKDELRVVRGKLAIRASGPAKGFQVLLPHGRVVDLGTEFGIRVEPDGAADVLVFEGKVEAYPAKNGTSVAVTQSQSARIGPDQITLDSTSNVAKSLSIARQIKSQPRLVERRTALDFSGVRSGTLTDQNGVVTGLTHRLPGTGAQLPTSDPNLLINPEKSELRLTTTRSDINHRFRLDEGEYLGFRLADLGFTGSEDFEVSAVIPDIPSLPAIGQFGLYAGSRCDRCIRGGLISQKSPNRYSQFMVNNEAGFDRDATFVGLVSPGNDVRVILRRQDGRYALTVENLTSGASSSLSIPHLASMDAEGNMYVGFFGANTGSEERETLTINELSATVWTKE